MCLRFRTARSALLGISAKSTLLVVAAALVPLVAPFNSLAALPPIPPDAAGFADVPGLDEDYLLRAGLDHCRIKFTRDKSGIVAYVGGSITAAHGWSQLVDAELQRRFPATKFSFLHAGIPSIDSSGHAFRLSRDVFQKAVPDLIFVEAAVNDLHNSREATERERAMEGIVRHAIKQNRHVDIVFLHFAEPRHTADYERGKTPEVIASHEKVAERYQIPSVNLAREVQQRMKAGQFDWARDFRDLHPSEFGHRLYAQAIKRLFDRAWAKPLPDGAAKKERTLGEAMDRYCYDAGNLERIGQAQDLHGFRIEPNWKPADKASTRDGFVGVPMLIGEKAGDSFRYAFEGRGIGFFLTSGPDTGVVEYRIDDGNWKRRDTVTQWSKGLHLPWVLMLETELESKPHVLEVRMAEGAQGRGTALRIRDILVNGSLFNLSAKP